MKVYSCDGCVPNNGPCLLTVQQDEEAPDREPVDADLADQIRLSGEEIKAGCLISFDELCRELAAAGG